ncbi:MAG: bifunctional diaminohydroxyphosphoribosylaminopyrimidine deaminase/5-amino-6-(5-phosphoribosylamino)uracil reductase RibD, partial [Bacteroidales bacterium]|nr:bifunctional diaminohydroxyphosphoribosylaminopyrimidine deaminase/5-amino-6-(5-phosphoribosylamino)uracil reductase RibD [Bacteroidales bacterium]
MQTMTFFMRRCLAVAGKGRGAVSPNPMVGCLIVHDGRIIAEGYHRQYGGPHAEVEAIENARARGLSHLFPSSTLYVSLEPCSHYGKTPPCAVKVAESGFKRVVVACGDPNPAVSGRGIALLREKGIEVTTGVLADEARFLNRRFMVYISEKRPYVILKWAQSADGFIAPAGGQSPCTVTDARMQVENHKLRAQEDAIWVGAHTL